MFNAGIGTFGTLGPLTQRILVENGYPLPLYKSQFDEIMAKTNAVGKDYNAIASKLHSSISTRRINDSLSTLKSIANVSDYKEVKYAFESKKIGVTRKSIVTALTDAYAMPRLVDAAANRILLENEFTRIGLKKVADKWTI